ncbi:MAG: hypothetical protein H6722_08095 [Sandaracinus sp.]|nr:hypothetical protein [Sandaracinus sp.]
MIRSVGFFALLLAVACGGGSSESTESAETSSGGEHHGHHGHHEGHHEGHEGHGEHHHGDFPPSVDAFHHAFAEQWHGDRTAASVCPNAADLQDAAEAAVEDQQAAHPEVTARVSQTADTFVAACQAEPEGGEAFETAFSAFHDALHALMDATRVAE